MAIARALYSDPKILILDEITSVLDLENENQILKTLKDLDDNVTIIIISHNENTFKICNEIVKLD